MESFGDANLKKLLNLKFGLPVASLLGGGVAGLTPVSLFWGDTNFIISIEQKRKKTMRLISLKMFRTLEWTKNDLKHLLKHLFREGVLIC